MPSQSPHPDMTPVERNVRSLANSQNQQKRGPSGNSQLPPANRPVSMPAGDRDTSQGGSCVPSAIKGQKSTHLSSLNNSRVADITQHMASTQSATLRRSIILQPPRRSQVVVAHQRPKEPYRQTQRVTLYTALHPALLALRLLSAVLKTCLPPSLIQKPTLSLPIH
jgi:hypothetical protein